MATNNHFGGIRLVFNYVSLLVYCSLVNGESRYFDAISFHLNQLWQSLPVPAWQGRTDNMAIICCVIGMARCSFAIYWQQPTGGIFMAVKVGAGYSLEMRNKPVAKAFRHR
ncbi:MULTISPECIES: hypothetical protein [Aeromonas]|uniref:hypothetical protein n=1 Tax=Aeromonas TaxID=642 RepID=UPI002A74957F|nr:hypothetical protein [Aeromonas jandaei]